MTSNTASEREPRTPDTYTDDAARSEEEVIEIEDDDDIKIEEITDESQDQQEQPPERPKTPAYVAPIGKIGPISPISPGIQVSPTDRIQLPHIVGAYLVGKKVDEYGDIVDDKNGQVLAQAGGDLPSIVGRSVSNAQGDILGDNGELLGYVADIDISQRAPGRGSGSPSNPAGFSRPRSLVELMGMGTASLMVDHQGNILDAHGNAVGKFHDNNNPMHRKEKEEREAREAEERRRRQKAQKVKNPETPPYTPKSSAEKPEQQERREQEQQQQQQPDQEPEQEPEQEQRQNQGSRPRRSESERRRNAESWRKENPNESPSDIFLDVKSTTEGIQLTIRIPTVFNGKQTMPNITFS